MYLWKMIYVLDENRKFSMSYSELREEYHRFKEMSDDLFMLNLQGAAHLACVICFLKEIPTYLCLNDTGIVHELIHLMVEDGTTTEIEDIRKLFNLQLELA